MIPTYALDSYKFDTMADMYHIQVKDKILGKDWLECFATDALDENINGLTSDTSSKLWTIFFKLRSMT